MSAFSDLPVILVSAKTEDAANQFITELIDNSPPSASGDERVWRIVNKYYWADVRLTPHADGATPPPPNTVEGHVIYLAEDEANAAAGEARAGAGAGAAVRVLACDAEELPADVAAWAARRRLEPVALREPPAPAGLAAARAALHAHVWPGLTRAPEEDEEWRAERWAAALGALAGVRALRGAERRAAAEELVAAVCRALGDDL